MSTRKPKQRMIGAEDWKRLADVPLSAQPLAMWLWLHLDPLGRGELDPFWIAEELAESPETVETWLLELLEAEFLTTYRARGREWILLLHPLKVDLRGTAISTPEPPAVSMGNPVAVGGGRERARERARAEESARADAWDAVQRDREAAPERPERPMLLDAPPMFCDEHMPFGTREKCGPCRDRRLYRDKWLTERIYEERLTKFYEQGGDDDEPF